MNVLLTGGSGMVGSFITPYLLKDHNVKVFDLTPPENQEVDFIQGSMLNPNDIKEALKDVEIFVNVTMKSPQGGSVTTQTIKEINENYELNTRGLHQFLFHAQKMGILKGVHTSTMSVHYRERDYYNAEEEIPLDTPSVYGLTKGFGELICSYFARWFDMNILALRITGPRTAQKWEEEISKIDEGSMDRRLWITHEEDLANAYLAGIDYVSKGHGRFESVFVAGDPNEKEHNLTKAKHLLNWTPRAIEI